jgi:hypothetical protein
MALKTVSEVLHGQRNMAVRVRVVFRVRVRVAKIYYII